MNSNAQASRYNNARRERRRHTRYPVQMPVSLCTGQRAQQEILTGDISLGGMFLRTDLQLRQHERVELKIALPGSTIELTLKAVVTRIARKGQWGAAVPGAGLSFEEMTDLQAEHWQDFVSLAESFCQTQGLRSPLRFVPQDHNGQEPIRRRQQRHLIQLSAHLETCDTIFEAFTEDVSVGGAFINTRHPLMPGDQVRLILIHPLDESEFVVEATVVRRGAGPNRSEGLGLWFSPLSHERICHLKLFVESSQAAMGTPTTVHLN